MLSTEPALRKAAVDRELRFPTEQYGCRQKNEVVKCAVLIQCHGKLRTLYCRYIISIHYYLLFVCVHAVICVFGIFIFSPILLSMNDHSDYDTIDGRIAGNRHPYPDIFFKVPYYLPECMNYAKHTLL